MTRIGHFLLSMTWVLAAAGCAQQPVRNRESLAAEAAHYGVPPGLLVSAARAGYSPKLVHGKAYFCTEQGQSFSYIPRARCFDESQMSARLQSSAEAVGSLRNRISTEPFDSPENGSHGG